MGHADFAVGAEGDRLLWFAKAEFSGVEVLTEPFSEERYSLSVSRYYYAEHAAAVERMGAAFRTTSKNQRR